jgi:hypothetical protein
VSGGCQLFAFFTIWVSTLLILSSVVLLIGGVARLWIAFGGSIVAVGVLFVAFKASWRRYDPAKETQKIKPKRKRTYDRLPY